MRLHLNIFLLLAIVFTSALFTVPANATDVNSPIVVAQGQNLPPALIMQIQRQHQGRIIGVTPQGPHKAVRVLTPQGKVVIVTVDPGTNRIVGVRN